MGRDFLAKFILLLASLMPTLGGGCLGTYAVLHASHAEIAFDSFRAPSYITDMMMEMEMKTKRTFEQWLQIVDFAIASRLNGLTHEDIEDWCYRSAYDDGMSPKTAASRAISNAMGSY